MARRSDHTRDEIREMALTAAERLLAKHGPAAVTTRAVAAKIGYTVGSLYLVFRNREDLLIQVNARTVADLHHRAQAAIEKETDPRACLFALGRTYLQFAFEHPARFRLLSESPLPQPVPSWYQERVEGIFLLIESKLTALTKRHSRPDSQIAARALWSGVHGICSLGLTGRLNRTLVDKVEDVANSLLTHYLAGYTGKIRPSSRPKKRK
jgi:AcrR family transcriptional regulator